MIFKSLDESQDINLDDYKGKLVLIVNIASNCGFIDQLSDLEEIWQRYKDRGLMIIGVPSDNFKQSPEDDDEIKDVCLKKYLISFPLTKKYNLITNKPHPFFIKVRKELGFLAGPVWNYCKYFVSPSGKILTWFHCFTEPKAADFINFIEDHLPDNSNE